MQQVKIAALSLLTEIWLEFSVDKKTEAGKNEENRLLNYE